MDAIDDFTAILSYKRGGASNICCLSPDKEGVV